MSSYRELANVLAEAGGSEKAYGVAIVSAVGGIIAASIPQFVKLFQDRKQKFLSDRRGVLLGRWEGEGDDYYIEDGDNSRHNSPRLPFSVVMTFTQVGRTVKANATIKGTSRGEKTTDTLVMSGMFYDNDYLQLSYSSPNMKQLGVVVLALKPDNKSLKGHYSGFSPRRSTIVAGSITTSKVE
jgi:hypothetical protein